VNWREEPEGPTQRAPEREEGQMQERGEATGRMDGTTGRTEQLRHREKPRRCKPGTNTQSEGKRNGS
jgi:hypothetical protein